MVCSILILLITYAYALPGQLERTPVSTDDHPLKLQDIFKEKLCIVIPERQTTFPRNAGDSPFNSPMRVNVIDNSDNEAANDQSCKVRPQNPPSLISLTELQRMQDNGMEMESPAACPPGQKQKECLASMWARTKKFFGGKQKFKNPILGSLYNGTIVIITYAGRSALEVSHDADGCRFARYSHQTNRVRCPTVHYT
jgi:hypothetical protein